MCIELHSQQVRLAFTVLMSSDLRAAASALSVSGRGGLHTQWARQPLHSVRAVASARSVSGRSSLRTQWVLRPLYSVCLGAAASSLNVSERSGLCTLCVWARRPPHSVCLGMAASAL